MTAVAAPATHVFGVRHHGPGSARSLVAALDRVQPEVLLIEGPADAEALAALAGNTELVPPIALMAYQIDDPARSVFWPLAEFSPEWQALRWAAAHHVPVRFCDLPSTQVLAPAEPVRPQPVDPIAALASAAGYDDPERWWEDVVESRGHEGDAPEGAAAGASGAGRFDAITEAMAAIRDSTEIATTNQPAGPADNSADNPVDMEAIREAQMRQVLRKARKDFATVAVVCGAWHAPALTGKLPPASKDAALLRGLPKVKTGLAWVPWTHSRLGYSSGYGAGIESPGWYRHLFTHPVQPVETWLTTVAHALRAADSHVSSAHVIEAVRLAFALAALRGRPYPGLSEVNQATEAVLCEGSATRFALVHRTLTVGESLGEVPEGMPVVPLLADLTKQQKSLRLGPDTTPRALTLDLRKPADLAKSHLLHRLRVLDIGWGEPTSTSGQGTFKEAWTVQWQPEFAVAAVLASTWGTTVAQACSAKLAADARAADTLADVSAAIEKSLVSGTLERLGELLDVLSAKAAVDTDLTDVMRALPTLGRTQRYGDVRHTSAAALGEVTTSLLRRTIVGLGPSLAGLGAEEAEQVATLIGEVTATIELLESDLRGEWFDLLARLSARDVSGIVLGRMVRLCLDGGRFTSADAAVAMRRALSVGSTAEVKSEWVQGFLADGGLLLVYDPELLGVLDEWLTGLSSAEFLETLPLVRRTFGTFDLAVRRNIGTAVRAGNRRVAPDLSYDIDRARPAVAAAAALFAAGLDADQDGGARRTREVS